MLGLAARPLNEECAGYESARLGLSQGGRNSSILLTVRYTISESPSMGILPALTRTAVTRSGAPN
jgi:hypothetical protein